MIIDATLAAVVMSGISTVCITTHQDMIAITSTNDSDMNLDQ